jgi:hypothetical protein
MHDLVLNPNMEPVQETRVITNPDGSWSTEAVTVTWVEVSADGKTITQTWETGLMVVSSTHGYTESHLVHVIAYDAAGNETESDRVRFEIIHKPKKEEEKEGESGAIWRRDEMLATSGERVSAGGRETAILLGARPLWWKGFG